MGDDVQFNTIQQACFFSAECGKDFVAPADPSFVVYTLFGQGH